MKTLKEIVVDAGGVAQVARELTVLTGEEFSMQRVHQWMCRNFVPAEFVMNFCEVTKTRPWEIRPDIYMEPVDYIIKNNEIKPLETVEKE